LARKGGGLSGKNLPGQLERGAGDGEGFVSMIQKPLLWVEVGKSACVLVEICELRLSPPARYDPQCPSHPKHTKKKLQIPSNAFLQMKLFEHFSAMKFL
jgi:hypothetical protein